MSDNNIITKKVYLYFPTSETDKPIIYHLVKDFGLIVNIFRARVTPEEEGYLSLEISGSQENIDRAFEFLATFEVVIHAGNKGLHWDSERCVHCGACLVHCPSGALSMIDRATRTVGFNEDICIECLACVAVCPYGACSSAF
jgi:NAD-dependent dihydropyrimidine dehydrogenase PreA subunit